MKQNTEPFEELMIPRRELHAPSAMIYRVYSDYKHFELVEAMSALDALAASKIKNVYKIERHDPLADNVIHLNQVINPMAAVSAATESALVDNIQPQQHESTPHIAEVKDSTEVPVETKPTEAAAPAPVETTPKEDAPLSNDDIDKLLNG